MKENFRWTNSKAAEQHRKPTQRINFSDWLKAKELSLIPHGDKVDIAGAMPENKKEKERGIGYLLSTGTCSGGAYTVLSARTSQVLASSIGRKELGLDITSPLGIAKLQNPDHREASIGTINAGLQEMVTHLNSPEAENIIISGYYSTGVDKILGPEAPKERSYGHIRREEWPSKERWSTEIVFDPDNFHNEILGCAKACLSAGVPFHIKGISKFIPRMNDLLHLPEVVRKPELIIGSWADEYLSHELEQEEASHDIELF